MIAAILNALNLAIPQVFSIPQIHTVHVNLKNVLELRKGMYYNDDNKNKSKLQLATDIVDQYLYLYNTSLFKSSQQETTLWFGFMPKPKRKIIDWE